MLNFESEMKAASQGYVVMSLDEYNRLRDEAASARAFMDKLIQVEHQSWSKEWVVELNNAAVYEVAKKMLEQTLGDAAAEYDIVPIQNFAYYSATIANPAKRKPHVMGSDDDADDILNSD